MVASILTYLYLLFLLYLLWFITSLPLTATKATHSNGFNMMGNWTHLPSLSPLGSKNKSTLCSGCLLPTDHQSKIHKCMFFSSGFKVKSISFRPCKVLYHPTCIKVGPPFKSRHFGKGTNGLQYPPCATTLPFICELCTTRTQIGRELDPHLPSDWQLLRLERMRMIDAAHAWAPRTLQNACRTIHCIDDFFTSCALPSIHHQLHLPSLPHPPLNISIPLFGV